MWRPTAQQTGPTTITDFETDLTGWNGDTGNWEVTTTTPVFHGSGVLKPTVTTAGWEHLRSIPGMGLPYYPSAGDSVSYRINFQSNTAAEVLVCIGVQQDTWTTPAYGLRFDAGDDILRLEKCPSAGSGFTALDSATVAFTGYESEWLRGTIDWGTDGTLVGTIYDAAGAQLGQVTATDTDYVDGGVAIEGNLRGPETTQYRIDYLTAE